MIKLKIDRRAFQAIRNNQRAIRQVIVAANIDLWNELVDGTPVDVGNARDSWWIQNDGAPDANPTKPEMNDTPKAAPGVPADLLNSAGKRTVFANSAAYIRRLEYEGWSAQAPTGWIRAAAAGYHDMIRRRVLEITGRG